MILFPHRSSVHSTADFLGFNVLLPGNLYLKSEVLLGFFFTHRILKLRKKKNHSKTFPIWNRPACMLSHVNHVWLFAVPWTVAHQALLSMEFSRQEYWSGLPCLSPGESSRPRYWTCIPYVSCIGRRVFFFFCLLLVPPGNGPRSI